MEEQTAFAKRSSWNKYWNEIWEDVIDSMIPDTEQFPFTYRSVTGTIYFVLLLGMFALWYHIYSSGTKSLVFLEPLETPNVASKNCELVPLSLSGEYLATIDGHWQGTDGYRENQAYFKLKLYNLQVTHEEYKTAMEDLYEEIKRDGALLEQHNLGYALIFFATKTYFPFGGTTQRFSLVGAAHEVFNRHFYDTALASVHGACNVYAATNYMKGDATALMTFNASEYGDDYYCMTAAKPITLNYDYHTKPRDFVIELDTKALSIALAVNDAIIDFSSLHEVDSSLKQHLFNQSYGHMGNYVDPRYPDMAVLVCFDLEHIDDVWFKERVHQCVIEFGMTYAMPVFSHIGKSLEIDEECLCTDPDDYSDPSHPCNIIRTITGFLFWNNSSLKTDPFGPVLQFIKKYSVEHPNDLKHLMEYANHDAFPLMYRVSHVGGSEAANDTNGSSYSRRRNLASSSNEEADDDYQHLYDFCTTEEYGACSVLLFTSYDDYATSNRFISPNFVSLNTGACNNTITPSQKAWDALIEHPFGLLTQSYQECHKDPNLAFLEVVGIAMGNVAVLAPFLFYLIMFFTVIWSWSAGDGCDDNKKTYSSAQKHRATNSLATALLLSRDGLLEKMMIKNDDSKNKSNSNDNSFNSADSPNNRKSNRAGLSLSVGPHKTDNNTDSLNVVINRESAREETGGEGGKMESSKEYELIKKLQRELGALASVIEGASEETLNMNQEGLERQDSITLTKEFGKMSKRLSTTSFNMGSSSLNLYSQKSSRQVGVSDLRYKGGIPDGVGVGVLEDADSDVDSDDSDGFGGKKMTNQKSMRK